MDLILWRHADSPPAAAGQDDLARPLTPKGERQARQAAEWLDRRLPSRARILVSPALRCQLTVRPLDRAYETVPGLAPDLPARQILDAVAACDADSTVLVVGHQPTLGEVAAWLIAGVPGSWSIKKGAVWWLRSREGSGGGRAELLSVQTPELL